MKRAAILCGPFSLPIFQIDLIQPGRVVGLIFVAVHLECHVDSLDIARFGAIGAVQIILLAVDSYSYELRSTGRGSVKLEHDMVPGVSRPRCAGDRRCYPTMVVCVVNAPYLRGESALRSEDIFFCI